MKKDHTNRDQAVSGLGKNHPNPGGGRAGDEKDACMGTAEMAGIFRNRTPLLLEHDISRMRLGAWRLLRPLGKGGMGSVWLGERCDAEFKMQVAIKLIKDHLVSSESIERFKRERQILADLNHPHIAVLHDGGTTPDGWPYLVMEYVSGQTIDVWNAARKPPIDELLQIFGNICSAVHHAHQNGILHRDIKPHNIMVTQHNQPKLLDFGIAVREHQDKMTATGLSPMTPAYAAPERLRGGPATIAADIYALGLVLLELIRLKTPTLPDTPLEVLDEISKTRNLERSYPGLVRGLRAALKHNPDHRPETVDFFRKILFDKIGSENSFSDQITLPRPLSEKNEEQLIPSGVFLMGRRPDKGVPYAETPQHRIDLPAFYLSRYPVTNVQYALFLEATQYERMPQKAGWSRRRPPEDRMNHPVTGVSWFDAQAYCQWLSQETGRRYRLPGEAEWEKAAGGLGGQRYPWGDQWDASYCLLGKTTVPLDSRQQSPFGCCQMAGFIQEWTSTRWGNDPIDSDYPYPYSKSDGRESGSAAFYIHRGGSFRDPPERIGARVRGWSNPAGTFKWRGFRVLREI